MKRAAALLILMATLPALANEESRLAEGEARSRASEAQLQCGGALSSLDGLSGVSLAGSGTDYRLIIVVRDLRTKLMARELLGGDVYGGVKVMWCVSNPSAAAPKAPAPAAYPAAAPRPLPAPAFNPPPTRNYASFAPVETRRTFWAGPAQLTPPRRYDYARSSNCHPSRYGFLVARCPTTSAPSCRPSGGVNSIINGSGAASSCASVGR